MFGLKTGLIAVAVTAASFAFGSSASAATFASCVNAAGDTGYLGTTAAYDISGKVFDNPTDKNSISSACTISETFSQDFLKTTPLTVNAGSGFFGETNWDFAGKIAPSGNVFADPDDDNAPEQGGSSGTFDLSALGLTGEVMIVFKSGEFNSNKGQGTHLVGYLLDSLVGAWDTPFLAPPFTLPGSSVSKEVSHISVYTAPCPPGNLFCGPNTTTTPVPVPAGLPLMLTAIGVGAYMRKRARKSA